ncbi:hypothetical protein BVX98_02020 [bacterium F11]|nr:hypothetical protein BVX98_02020 [bacterium F11]
MRFCLAPRPFLFLYWFSQMSPSVFLSDTLLLILIPPSLRKTRDPEGLSGPKTSCLKVVSPSKILKPFLEKRPRPH